MPNLNNSLSLNDQASAVFDKIASSAQNLNSTLNNLNTNVNTFNSNPVKSQSATINITTKAVNNLNTTVDQTSKSATAATKSLKGMSVVKFAVLTRALKQISNLVSNITDSVDELSIILAIIDSYNFSDAGLDEFAQYLYQVSRDTRTEFQETANIVRDLLSTGLFKGENASINAIRTTEVINQAVIGSGLTGNAATQAAERLTNALAQGELTAANVTTLLRNTPKIADYIAEGFNTLGYTIDATRYNLKQMATDGELTADRVVLALHAASETIQADFEAMPRTFSQVKSQFSSTWQYVLLQLNATEGPLQRIVDQFARIADWLGSNEALPLWNALAVVIGLIAAGLEKAIDGISIFYNWIISGSPAVNAVLATMATIIGINIVGSIGKAITSFLRLITVSSSARIGITAIGLAVGVTAFAISSLGIDAEKVFTWIGHAVGSIAQALAGVVSTLVNALGTVIIGIAEFFGDVVHGISSSWEILALLSDDKLSFIVAISKDAAINIGNAFISAFSVVGDVLDGIISSSLGLVDELTGSNYLAGWNASKEPFDLDSFMGLIELLNNSDIDWFYMDLDEALAVGQEFDELMNGFTDILDTSGSKTPNRDAFIASIDDEELRNQIEEIANNDSWQETIDGLKDELEKLTDSIDDWATELPELGETLGADLYALLQGLFDSIDLDADTDILDAILAEIESLDLDTIALVEEVGQINTDVNIADEDLKLWKDIASDKFRSDINDININIDAEFGDINSEVDIENMFDELADQLADRVATQQI